MPSVNYKFENKPFEIPDYSHLEHPKRDFAKDVASNQEDAGEAQTQNKKIENMTDDEFFALPPTARGDWSWNEYGRFRNGIQYHGPQPLDVNDATAELNRLGEEYVQTMKNSRGVSKEYIRDLENRIYKLRVQLDKEAIAAKDRHTPEYFQLEDEISFRANHIMSLSKNHTQNRVYIAKLTAAQEKSMQRLSELKADGL